MGAIALEVRHLLFSGQHILLGDIFSLPLALATFLVENLVVVYVI